MKEIKCAVCNILVAKIEPGSSIKKGAIMLCHDCEINRQTLEQISKLNYGNKTNSPDMGDFGKIFGDMFGKKGY